MIQEKYILSFKQILFNPNGYYLKKIIMQILIDYFIFNSKKFYY